MRAEKQRSRATVVISVEEDFREAVDGGKRSCNGAWTVEKGHGNGEIKCFDTVDNFVSMLFLPSDGYCIMTYICV